jgi:dolichyl-phosphate-mannose-protein mannosyltransferase
MPPIDMFAIDQSSKKPNFLLPWYQWAMIGIFVFSIAIRFWGLGRFAAFVFDEVYYAVFGNNYLTHTKFFNAHPPFSQYIIAIGIWLGEKLPIGHDTIYTDAKYNFARTTFSYRWFNAIFGSFIPPVVGFIAYQLTKRPTYMVLASLLMALDGLFLVDSRYALNNVFLILFGLLGQLLLLMGLSAEKLRRWAYLGGSGVFFGLSIACKWNGLWLLLGIWLLLGFLILHQLLTGRSQTAIQVSSTETEVEPSVLVKLSRIKLWEIGLFLVIVPAGIYAISWIPHIQQNPEYGFWQMQGEILGYHEKVKNGKAVHPYCANWYTWPLMMRPLAYYYQVVQDLSKNPALDVIYDVHAIGNPILWWLAFGVVIRMTWQLLKRLSLPMKALDLNSAAVAMPVFFLANYGANLFPWMRVTRCVYIYHYMGSLVFAVLALAWFIDRWLHGDDPQWRGIGITLLFAIAVAFVWWLPIYLGLPLNRVELSMRMWFNQELWREIGEMWNWI